MKSITPVVVAVCALILPVATQGKKPEHTPKGPSIAHNEFPRYHSIKVAVPDELHQAHQTPFKLLESIQSTGNPQHHRSNTNLSAHSDAEVLIF